MPDRPTPVDSGTSADFHLSQEPVTPAVEAPAAPPAPAYEYLGELPANYGASSLYLVAYDPRRLFAYWDLDAATVTSVDAPLALRVCRVESGEVESQVDLGPAVDLTTGVAAGGGPGRYLPIQHSGISYFAELGTGGGATGRPWHPMAVSSQVVVPPEGLAAAEDGDARFATLPFHLSFQRLTELLRATVQTDGQPLTEALANLQHDAHATPADAALVEALGQLDEEQRDHLKTVLGWEVGLSFPADAGSSSPSGGAAGDDTLSSLGVSSLAGNGITSGGGSGGLTSAGAALSSASAIFSAQAAGGSEGGGLSSGAMFAAGLSSAALLGARGAGASGGGILGPAPSSEAWRRAVAAGAVAGSSGGSDQFARERAERFLRAVTSSLDVLSPLFSGDLVAGGSSTGGSSVGGSSGR